MQAKKDFILKVIETPKILFTIPVYQRNYDWPESNCRRLLEDIEDIFLTQKQHFFGSIILLAEPSLPSLTKYIVIDGQQRLTTMCLLVKALHDVVLARGDKRKATRIDDDYIHNRCDEEEFKIKLKPINSDGEQFMKLLNNKSNTKPDGIDESSHIWLNYNVCRQRIEKWIDQGNKTPEEIKNAFYRLEIITMGLEADDDPQVIFENINSTGLELTYSDLIRNFLLMKSDQQDVLYKNYWLIIENLLKTSKDYKNLNDFFMQYIVCRTGKKVNESDLYYVFADFYKNNGYTQQQILLELRSYADIYSGFLNGKEQWGQSICDSLAGLRQLKQTTCYPFLMNVFNDWLNNNIIKDRTVEKTVELILTYLLRRVVCGVSTGSLRGLFASLYNRIFGKVPRNKEKYYEAINNFLFLLDSKDAMPTEEKFAQELKVKEIYKTPALCNFLLKYIENNGKEKIEGLITIEHIMPQTLSVGWEQIETPDHGKYVHTLGNLTLTGYNSELSNLSFKDKKDYLFNDPDGKVKAKAVTLNKDVQYADAWDVAHIVKRADRLTNIILKDFGVEHVYDDSIEYELTREILANQSKEATGTKPLGFKFYGKKYKQVSYSGIMSDVIKLLYQKYPDILQNAVEDPDFGWIVDSPDKVKNKSADLCKISDRIYIDTHNSASAQLNNISRLLDKCGEPQNVFVCIIPATEYTEEYIENYDGEDND